jgi:drug/metabolite transporter (DMT)-like permease
MGRALPQVVGPIVKGPLHLIRIALSTLETAFFYWAVSYLPLADVMIYYLAAPIYVAALATLFLGERINVRQGLSILLGFGGVLLVLRPSWATLTSPALIAIGGSLFFALLMITTRHLRSADERSLVLGQTLGALLFGAIASLASWTPPGPGDFLLLMLLGVVAMLAQVCVNRSLRLAPASVVTPYQYTSIVWAIVLGYLVFGDLVDVLTFLGAAIIIASGFILFLTEYRSSDKADPAQAASGPGASTGNADFTETDPAPRTSAHKADLTEVVPDSRASADPA